MNTENDLFSVNNPYQVSATELTSDGYVDPTAASQARRGSSGFAVVAIAMFVLSLIAGGMLLLLLGQFASLLITGRAGDASFGSLESIVQIPAWLALLAVPVGQVICYRVPESVISKRWLAGCMLGYLATLAIVVLAVFASFARGLENFGLVMVVAIVGAFIAYLAPMVSQLFFLTHVRALAQRVGAQSAASLAFVARIGFIVAPILLFFVGGLSFMAIGGISAVTIVLAAIAFVSLLVGTAALLTYGLCCWHLFRFLAKAGD